VGEKKPTTTQIDVNTQKKKKVGQKKGGVRGGQQEKSWEVNHRASGVVIPEGEGKEGGGGGPGPTLRKLGGQTGFYSPTPKRVCGTYASGGGAACKKGKYCDGSSGKINLQGWGKERKPIRDFNIGSTQGKKKESVTKRLGRSWGSRGLGGGGTRQQKGEINPRPGDTTKKSKINRQFRNRLGLPFDKNKKKTGDVHGGRGCTKGGVGGHNVQREVTGKGIGGNPTSKKRKKERFEADNGRGKTWAGFRGKGRRNSN